MSDVAAADWKLDQLGEWTEPSRYEVTREACVAYAEATNDEHPKHLSGELAPPVFAIVPAFQVAAQPVGTIVPGEVIMRVVHGEQDFALPPADRAGRRAGDARGGGRPARPLVRRRPGRRRPRRRPRPASRSSTST